MFLPEPYTRVFYTVINIFVFYESVVVQGMTDTVSLGFHVCLVPAVVLWASCCLLCVHVSWECNPMQLCSVGVWVYTCVYACIRVCTLVCAFADSLRSPLVRP